MLSPITMLSPKEIYERVSEHLLTQRAVSEDDNGSCRLRSPEGRKCAIGSLVRDELYEPELEGVGISYYRHARDGRLLRALYASNVNAYDPNIIDLLIELEEVHDYADIDEWPELLAALGKRHAFV
ncbi:MULTISPECIES: hypothetical protein [Caballeronia]|uniref:Uncharacterized protein n=2 Tax=Caballeronia TaxID=1827195 RepID=A0ACB5QTS6_9BURK|nr:MULTISPECIES: hypothetical protein [Caballeronia]GJH07579.1 hypothetical protein CBA19CS11_02095 [Caballeronia novacaledonica]GJH18575.1 hypothetical protein CBA19CS22_18555 [Caballeronia novacaledonica]